MIKKEFSVENKKTMDELSEVLKKSQLPRGQLIGLLEILKTDMILNSGCVVIDGKQLNNVDDE